MGGGGNTENELFKFFELLFRLRQPHFLEPAPILLPPPSHPLSNPFPHPKKQIGTYYNMFKKI